MEADATQGDFIKDSLGLHDPADQDAGGNGNHGHQDIVADVVHDIQNLSNTAVGKSQIEVEDVITQADHDTSDQSQDGHGDGSGLALHMETVHGTGDNGLHHGNGRGQCGKYHRNKEQNANRSTYTAHGMKHLGEGDEHQAGTGGHAFRTHKGVYCRNDHHTGQEGHNGIEQLNLVEKNSKYLLSLINQLLDFRKFEDGRMKIICHHGNINTFLDDLLTPFVAFAGDHGITLKSYKRIDNPYMMFDEDIMRKVITNLISNAIKFTEKGGVVSVYAATVNDNGGEKLYICVRDTGKGIPEGDIEKIFNRFYQADNQGLESVSGQSGTGIGLYLCKKLITLLEGSLVAMNNPVQGSSFRILLPVERGDKNEIVDEVYDDEHDEVSLSPEKNGKLNILIVEDNKDMRDYIRSILAEYYNVLEASNGEEALHVLSSSNVDFVISDLMMPVMDGMELSHRIRSDFSISHIPILMLTAKTSDEARLEGYKAGVDSYLLKPFDENLLLARISGILENRKRFQQKFYLTMDVDSLEIDEESGDKKFLDKAMKVVKENYMNPDFDVADFINAMGMSKSLLNKKMQSLTGQSTNQFMRNYRLNLARELLLKNKVTHNMNISEIAYQVGFNDPKYFTRCFTKHFNVTPSSIMEDK